MQELGLKEGVMHCSSLAYGRHEEVLDTWQATRQTSRAEKSEPLVVVLRQLLAGEEGKLLGMIAIQLDAFTSKVILACKDGLFATKLLCIHWFWGIRICSGKIDWGSQGSRLTGGDLPCSCADGASAGR
jgi:hypothetical protein